MKSETRHSFVLMVGTGTTAILGLIYTIYAARVLGPEDYAVFGTVVSLVMMCQLALGPINETITRFSAEYAGEGNLGKVRTLAHEVGKRIAAAGLVGLLIALLLTKPLAEFLKFDETGPLFAAYAMMYLTILISIGRGVLRGVQRFGAYNGNILTEAAARLLAGFALLAWLGTVTSGLAAYVVALAITLCLSVGQLRSVWRGHERQALDGRAVRRFTLPIFVTMITYAAFHNLDMILVKHYFPAAEAGIYGAAFALARAMATIVTPFSTLLVPLLSTLRAQGKAVSGPFLRIVGYFSIMALLVLLIFGLFPHQIMRMFTPEYAAGSSLLLPLAVVRLIGFFSFLIALAGAAVNRFTFLWVFVPGLLIEAAVLWLWHDTLRGVIFAIMIVQGVTLAAMIVLAATALKTKDANSES